MRMASDRAVTKVHTKTIIKSSEYLPEFNRLNHKVFLYMPTDTNKKRNVGDTASQLQHGAGPAPTLIYLSTWMNAQDKHIAKYVSHYQRLYPSSPILLVKSTSRDFFFNSSFRQKLELAPAIATVRSYTAQDEESNTPGGGILIHALSNGGSGNISLVSRLYLKETGRPLPAKAFILDSTPGKARLADAVVTLTHNAPRAWYILWPMRLTFGVLLILFYFLPELLGQHSLSSMNWQTLNSRHPEYISSDAVRSYIYSEKDSDIRASDVAAHAREAADAGFRVLEQAVFHGTAHVAHMRHDANRYWGVVQRTWLAAHSSQK